MIDLYVDTTSPNGSNLSKASIFQKESHRVLILEIETKALSVTDTMCIRFVFEVNEVQKKIAWQLTLNKYARLSFLTIVLIVFGVIDPDYNQLNLTNTNVD